MIPLFTLIYFLIYIQYRRLNQEIGLRKVPTVYKDVKPTVKVIIKQYAIPLAIIAVMVFIVDLIAGNYAMPVLILGTYILSRLSRRKVKEINLFDLKDGDKNEW